MAPRPQPTRKPQGRPQAASSKSEASADPDGTDAADEPADGSDGQDEPKDQDDELEDDGDDNDVLNEVVEPTINEPPVVDPEERVEPPKIPDGCIAILNSPRPFGIHIPVYKPDGKIKEQHLHHFRKGKTPLTKVQHDTLSVDSYVTDQGAEILYRPAPAAPKKK